MPPVVRVGLRWLIGIMACLASFAFGAGQWTSGIEERLDVHCDSIYVSTVKIAQLEQRSIELEALHWNDLQRIETLEARVDSITAAGMQIQRDIYTAVTGEEWQP